MTSPFKLTFVPLTVAERNTAFVFIALLLVWPFLPHLSQSQAYHLFADQRWFCGVPHAADVLSNALMGFAGLLGLYQLVRGADSRFEAGTRASLTVFFIGFVLTCLGSGFYHLHPADSTLIWDRLPMTVVFAGTIGIAAAQRISTRAGFALLYGVGVAGLASIGVWVLTGGLALYVIVQFGGIVGLLMLLLLTRQPADPFPWFALLGWYAVAKVFETADTTVWALTHHFVAGHAIKHLACGMAAFSFVQPFLGRRSS